MKALIQILSFMLIFLFSPLLQAQPSEADLEALRQGTTDQAGKRDQDKADADKKQKAKSSATESKNAKNLPSDNAKAGSSSKAQDSSKSKSSAKQANKKSGIKKSSPEPRSRKKVTKTPKEKTPKSHSQKPQVKKPASAQGLQAHDLRRLVSLQEDFAKLVSARDSASLRLFCESRWAHEVIDDPSALSLWQKMCRAEVLRIEGDFSGSRKALTDFLHERPLKEKKYQQAQRDWQLHAKFSLASMAKTEFLQFQPCLGELGDNKRVAVESALWEKQRLIAEEAYRDIVQSHRGDAGLRALSEIIQLSDSFYRRLTGVNKSLRSVVRTPPLLRYSLPQTRLLHAVLGRKNSELRSSVILAYARLLRQARSQGGSGEMIAKIQTARENFKEYKPSLPDKVLPDWPSRASDKDNIQEFKASKGAYLLKDMAGHEVKLSTDKALPRMRKLAAMLDKGYWAPRACIELARMKDSDSLPLLYKAAQSQTDKELQIAAIYALGKMGDPASLPTLFSLFRSLREKAARPLFDNPVHTFFGQPERIIDAIVTIGKIHPQSLQSLLEDGYLPSEEAAYVLWAVKSKSLYGAYNRMREHANPRVAAYGIMALVDLQGETARWMLNDRDGNDPLLRCVKAHLRESL